LNYRRRQDQSWDLINLKKTWEAGSRDGKMAFNEKPLTLNNQLDSFIARRSIQDDTIKKKYSQWAQDELESKR